MPYRFHYKNTSGRLGAQHYAKRALSVFFFVLVCCLNKQSARGGTAPAASLSPASLAFASQAIGNPSAAQSITLSNPGSAALSISSIAITGMSINDFAQTNTCGTALAAGSACTISVTFTPTATGSRYANVTLTDNAAGSPQTVSLTGTGAAVPGANLSPGSLAFASQPIGNPSAAQSITLSNPGSAALSISSIAITGMSINDFAQTNTCGSSLAAGSACTISVTFTPTATGTRYANVTLSDNGAGSPQTLSLTGTGAAVPGANLSPGSLAFASQAIGNPTAAQSLTLSNPGSAALSITGIAITGVSINDFAQANTCGSSLAAGSACTISVTFTPTASGARYASVTLNDNAAGSPQTVSLTGTGAAVPNANPSPGSLTFASEPIGNPAPAQIITLSNPGSAALSISSIAITGMSINDFVQTNTCGSSLAAGSACTISVIFSPTASGARYADVTLTDNAAGSPQSVSVSGTGTSTGSTVSLSSSSLTFGNEPVDTTSSPQSITLDNTGSTALSITSIAFTGANPTDFAENSTCGSSLAAGGTCTVAISFTPAASGAVTASLSVTDSASGSPQSVALSGTGTHDVVLTWTASPTTGIAGYNVYRGTSPGGESSTPLNSTPINGITYVDENVTAGTEYYYVVTAVASNGVTQSADSNQAPATVPSP